MNLNEIATIRNLEIYSFTDPDVGADILWADFLEQHLPVETLKNLLGVESADEIGVITGADGQQEELWDLPVGVTDVLDFAPYLRLVHIKMGDVDAYGVVFQDASPMGIHVNLKHFTN